MKVLPDYIIKKFDPARLMELSHRSEVELVDWVGGQPDTELIAGAIVNAASQIIEELLCTWQHEFSYGSSDFNLSHHWDPNKRMIYLHFSMLVADQQEQDFSDVEMRAWNGNGSAEDFPLKQTENNDD